MTPPMPLEFVLVSSDYAAATAISHGIKKYGAKSSLSPGAESARDSLRRRKVDGVFLDTEAPGALELIIDIRKGTSNSKSVIFAGVQSSKESAVTLSAGANFLLLRPLTAESVALHLTIAKEMMEREHRRYFRHPVNLPVLLKDADGDQRARMANLSEGGVAVRTTRELKHSSMIDFAFELPFGATVSGRGQVAWTNREGMSGILVHSFHGQGREHLDAWLAAREQLSTPAVLPPRSPSADAAKVLKPNQVRDNAGQETKVRFARLPSSVTRNIPQAANVPFPGGGIQWKRCGKTSSLPFE